MSSSTSNSNLANIWTACGLGLLLLIGYEGVLRSGRLHPGAGTSQGQGNTVKMERLVFGPKNPPVVLVGSSLTYNLPPESVYPGAVNVGLGAGDSATPLRALQKAQVKPKVVVIEMSPSLLKGTDEDALHNLFNPVSHALVGNFHLLRQSYQPFNVFSTAGRLKKFGNLQKIDRDVSESVRQESIQRNLEKNQVGLNPTEIANLNETLDVIDRSIQYIRAEGGTALLVSIPGQPEVDASPRVTEIRQLCLQRFPMAKYQWLPTMDYQGWKTNDGVHLVHSDTLKFCEYLHGYLQGIIKP